MEVTSKAIFLLKSLYKDSNLNKGWLFDLVSNSEFQFEDKTKWVHDIGFPGFNVTLHTHPEVYPKYYSELSSIVRILKDDLYNLIDTPIYNVRILPDYNKIEIHNSEIRLVVTAWQELNAAQKRLVEQLKTSNSNLDIKNIGNSARNVLQQIANIVFKEDKHLPGNKSIDVSNSKFKNQLHSYIRSELTGDSVVELRKFAEAAIELAENAVDLANSVTHRTETERTVAEVCVVGTITVISIINYIENR